MALSALALAALVLRAVAYLASWYPGDETIRASSESFLRLMFSRSGVSFGTIKSFALRARSRSTPATRSRPPAKPR